MNDYTIFDRYAAAMSARRSGTTSFFSEEPNGIGVEASTTYGSSIDVSTGNSDCPTMIGSRNRRHGLAGTRSSWR